MTNKKIIFILHSILLLYMLFIVLYTITQSAPIIPIHWNFLGQADRTGSRYFLIFPLILFIVTDFLMLLFTPQMDKHVRNSRITAFVLLLITSFFAVILTLICLLTLGLISNPLRFITFILSIFFIILAQTLPRIPRNHFLGVRTPWTLHYEFIWLKTHQFTRMFWTISGALQVAITLIYAAPLIISVTLLLCITTNIVVPIIYSYLLFKKTQP